MIIETQENTCRRECAWVSNMLRLARTGALGCAREWFICGGTQLNRYWTCWNIDSLHMKPGGTCGHSSLDANDARHFLEFCVVSRMLAAHPTLFERSGLWLWYVVSLDGWCFSLSVPFCFVGRLAAFAPRFAKSRVVPWELGMQVYVDDPILIAAGSREQRL